MTLAVCRATRSVEPPKAAWFEFVLVLRMTDLTSGPTGNRLLDGLAPEALERLRPHLRLTMLRRGQVLREQGSWKEYVYFPVSGVISLQIAVDEDVSPIEVGLVGNEGMVGAPILFSEGSEEPAIGTAQVLIGGSALQMSVRILRDLARQDPILLMLAQRYLRARFVESAYYAACNGRHSLEERLARWLLGIVDRSEDNATEVSHAQIANVLGVGRSGITLALAEFKTSGLIKSVPGRIAIMDRAGLEAASCGCYLAIRRAFEDFRKVT
jgi:CRP-like cAMP-binding protein